MLQSTYMYNITYVDSAIYGSTIPMHCTRNLAYKECYNYVV